jgi:hypothetical protein
VGAAHATAVLAARSIMRGRRVRESFMAEIVVATV